MSVITLKQVIHKGKPFFGCRIPKDANLQEILEIYAQAIIDIEKSIDLNSVRLKELGIIETCKLKAKNLLSEIINILIASDKSLSASIAQVQTTINNFSTTVANIKDEKVKLTASDSSAGYLADKITSDQIGSITQKDNKLVFMGFCPIGTVVYIDASRLGDFDGTGKGKTNTDVWGWALSNGQNGTRNRMQGQFPRYVSIATEAGNSGGATSAIVDATNIKSFNLTVNGSIGEALTTPVKAKIRFNTNRLADGSGGSTVLLRHTPDGNGNQEQHSEAIDGLKHSHSFSLNAAHSNPNPTAISIVPSYIYEIPIQRINV